MTRTLLNSYIPKLWLTTLSLLAFFILPAAYAQNGQGPLRKECAAMEVLNRQLIQDPGRARALEAIEAHTRQFIKAQGNARSAATVITIPVVVHVVYNTAEQNISSTQIKSQIAILNEDFRRLNANADNTWSQAADVEIEFKLATVNPMGTSTQGITRTATNALSFDVNDGVKSSKSGGRNPWPSKDYLNIWVCNLKGAAGYAQFPGGAAATDGIVIGYKFFGTGGTTIAPYNLGRTTTHEVGHWLNLRHIWGDGGCDVDDGVADTPPADAPNYGCAKGYVSCNAVNMVENYMDYSEDGCMNLFTQGQKDRMRALFARGGARSSLLSSAGLGGGQVAECAQNQLNLNLVLDYYGSETSWEIRDASGLAVISGGPYETGNVTIRESYCLPDGCYDFVIRDAFGDGICCNYGNGSYSLTDSSGNVLAGGGIFTDTETSNFCFTETTASCQALNFNNHSIIGFSNQDISGSHQVQDAGATLYIEGNTWKQISYNYNVTENTVLEFEYRSDRMGDIQGIAFENDNSITGKYSFRVYGNQIWGIGNYDDYSGTDWKKYVIPVGSFYTGSFNRLVFMGDDDYSGLQSSYFRHVKVYEGSCDGTQSAALKRTEALSLGHEAEAGLRLHLYPNPANDKLSLTLVGEKKAQVSLYTLTGQKVWAGPLIENQDFTLDVAALPAGVYTLRISGQSGALLHQKFIKQ